MKKAIVLLLSSIMISGLTACGNSAEQTEQVQQEEQTEQTQQEGQEEQTEQTDQSPAEDFAESSADSGPSEEGNDGDDTKVLVAYFSATHTTEGVAEHIADGLNAELYEIVPEEPYTDADLNYNNDNSRSTVEMNDPNARPAISGSVENMDQYTVVFIGYPIWWGEAPRIVSTFMESYDFSGKTIVPFCTSGGSGIGSSAENLEQLTSDAVWLEGRRLNGGDTRETIMEWVDSLELNLGE